MTAFAPRDPAFAARVRASFARQPFMETIGAHLTEVAPGRCTVELAYREDLTQQHGFLHAGLVGTLADNAAGYASHSLMAASSAPLTVEYKPNLLSPARGDRLVARAQVVKDGRTLKVCRADVFALSGGDESLCATATVTVMELAHTPDAPRPRRAGPRRP